MMVGNVTFKYTISIIMLVSHVDMVFSQLGLVSVDMLNESIAVGSGIPKNLT